VAERHSIPGIAQALVDTALRKPHAQGRDRHPAFGEDGQELRVAASRLALGTRQSSKDSSWVSEAAQPTLEYFAATVKPGVPAGTMIAEISLPPSGSCPVTAVIVTNAVTSVPELVMNALDPLMTHSSPSSTAVVRVAAASDPPPGSVSPNAPKLLPAHRSGNHCCFCCSSPNR
jgi:hypothetical protein